MKWIKFPAPFYHATNFPFLRASEEKVKKLVIFFFPYEKKSELQKHRTDKAPKFEGGDWGKSQNKGEGET